jgi:hypothetical protein
MSQIPTAPKRNYSNVTKQMRDLRHVNISLTRRRVQRELPSEVSLSMVAKRIFKYLLIFSGNLYVKLEHALQVHKVKVA